MRFCLWFLPIVGVGDLGTSAASPDGFALRCQRLEVVRQLAPIVLATWIQKPRDDFLWFYLVFRLSAGRENFRSFDARP